ncbi:MULTISPECIES: hypothetical protein [Vagococcus]|uniref:hypothetical protein n=1 Tax=Vagococcus TaxID=2737 RepID=UPI002FC96696
MKKLFIILLQPNVTLVQAKKHECQLLWTPLNKSFKVRLSDDGRLLVSPNPCENTAIFSLFKETFLKSQAEYQMKSGLNTLLISPHQEDYLFDSGFARLYQSQPKEKEPTKIIPLHTH